MEVIAPKTLGERIALARRELGARMSRDILPPDLAKLLDVSAPTVYNWESGRKNPTRESRAVLARVLGVTETWLEFGHEPKHPPAGAPAAREAAVSEGGIPAPRAHGKAKPAKRGKRAS